MDIRLSNKQPEGIHVCDLPQYTPAEIVEWAPGGNSYIGRVVVRIEGTLHSLESLLRREDRTRHWDVTVLNKERHPNCRVRILKTGEQITITI